MRGFRLLMLAVPAFFLVLSACVRQQTPESGAGTTIELSSREYVVAGELELRYDEKQGQFASIAAASPGILFRAHRTAPGRVRLAWVSQRQLRGPLLALTFTEEVPGLGLGDVRVFASGSETALNGEVLDLRPLSVTEARLAIAQSPEELTLAPLEHRGDHLPTLDSSFAQYRLGDLNQSGDIDVLDVLIALNIGAGGAASDYALYHSDLDGNEVTDVNDVLQLLDKAVDPTLAARAVVKPSRITFVQLTSGVPLLIGNSGNEPFPRISVSPPPGVEAQVVAGVEGHSAAYGVSLPLAARKGWLPGELKVDTLSDEVFLKVGNLVFLIAGQSNASGRGEPVTKTPAPRSEVRMLANDYLWKNAVEPLDDPTGQLDVVSDDGAGRALYSFGSELGHALWNVSGYYTYLIPSALGGTSTIVWKPYDRLNRDTLFGSANYRAQVSAGLQTNPGQDNAFAAEGGPVNVWVWYQGESDSSNETRRQNFIQNTHEIMDAVESELSVPVVYVQLAAHNLKEKNILYGAIAEKQRLMESSSGSTSRRSGFFMAVTNDLPLSEPNHLSATGQRILGERIALAIREHVLGEAVDGTGPRLSSVSYAAGQRLVAVDVDVPLTADASFDDYSGYFNVYDGPPQGTIDDVANYGQNAMVVLDVRLDPTNSRRLLIELRDVPVDTPYVRYMPPPGRSYATGAWDDVVVNVVRSASSGLPLPTFGPIPAQ